jgi:hypothetical protein
MRSARRSLRAARGAARDRPESLRLAGRVAWLRGRQDQAITLWRKAVGEAERLGARPELARLWRELAARIAEPSSRHAAFDGASPAELAARADAIAQPSASRAGSSAGVGAAGGSG